MQVALPGRVPQLAHSAPPLCGRSPRPQHPRAPRPTSAVCCLPGRPVSPLPLQVTLRGQPSPLCPPCWAVCAAVAPPWSATGHGLMQAFVAVSWLPVSGWVRDSTGVQAGSGVPWLLGSPGAAHRWALTPSHPLFLPIWAQSPAPARAHGHWKALGNGSARALPCGPQGGQVCRTARQRAQGSPLPAPLLSACPQVSPLLPTRDGHLLWASSTAQDTGGESWA